MTGVRNVTVYTDGACLGNPGPGGYGVVLLIDSARRELSGGFRRTTNNRMEIMAAIAGLEALEQPSSVVLYSDSRYLVDAMTKGWVRRWRQAGWRRDRNQPALNPDLWEKLLKLCALHQVDFRWVRGHAGNGENGRCDELAVKAAHRADLPRDEVYEFGTHTAGLH